MAEKRAGLSIVLGTMTFGWSKSSRTIDTSLAGTLLENFATRSKDYREIDTALIYMDKPGIAENMIREAIQQSPTLSSIDNLAIHTKAHPILGGDAPGLSEEGLSHQVELSTTNLGLKSIPLFYLHSPDPKIPLVESLEYCNKLHQKGLIGELGLSNYTSLEVKEAYELCKEKGWLKPTVYQGNYNCLNRLVEKDLFPVLKECGIRFLAYNPLAAGLLSGKYFSESGEISLPSSGRFHSNPNYQSRYWKEDTIEGMNSLGKIAKQHNLSILQIAFTWLLRHSQLSSERNDGIVLGVSSVDQLTQNLDAIEKAEDLPEPILKEIENVWGLCCDDAFQYSRGMSGGGGDASVGISK
eukprot:CAMPEP_0201488200 /NCGR_PEP_ID=MMETSP0151_2-20130828/17653_1 /ASSEMBLY_ACC=CAM_ASM_000257 /TAXON_ID=200890 /ORGANISM="Paramoeba atlantica, Strain 621/1 / CCAP 1560/9" /LENGTH=353 /DNA_ID=CAMNT_0047873447 /DNA_START=17 /DNA_END=1078 /DNA_ORIENTATION=+